MTSNNGAPDAWDDDWTHTADTKPVAQPAVKLTKAEKRAQHQQLQKEIWASAESPSRNLWLEAQGAVPLKQEFVPAMTVLSRKPQTAKREPGMAGLSLDDEDSEEEARKKRESELAERQRKAKLEREEKVRKYAEARERIMGTSATSAKKSDSRESSQGRRDARRRDNASGQPTSSRASPARVNSNGLFDPEDMSRRVPKKDNSGTTTPREGEPVRQPRGPDGTGRAGFGGFARAAKEAN